MRFSEPANLDVLVPLFARHRASFLMDTVLEGYLGSAIVDDSEQPTVARLSFADVIILGGNPKTPAALELVKQTPIDKGILPAPAGWRELLFAVHGERLIAIERYDFSGEALNKGHLQWLMADLPAGFLVERMDLELARQIVADSSLISEDHVRNFNSPEDFVERGIGYCVLSEGRIVSGASSYAVCNSGIEVQVNTHPDYRRQGLATIVSAALLLGCLEQDIEVHWDAGNEISARLAMRLGYKPAGSYEMLVRVA